MRTALLAIFILLCTTLLAQVDSVYTGFDTAIVSGQKDSIAKPVESSVLIEPQFEGGGINTFRQWVASQLVFPASLYGLKVKERVVISVIVEKDGSLVVDKVLLNPNTVLADEVLRVVNQSPKWEPATNNGVPVRYRMYLPVDFKTK